MGQKATRMQEEAMKMLGAANQVLKSILNLVYDLKEMKLLVQTYDDIKLKDSKFKNAARLSLKQRWMDVVDIKKGQGSINALASGNLDFVTLRDAFMIANSLKDVKDLDLNDRVKRILEQRVGEFLRWIDESERQLRTRYKVEINYLRSQVNTIKLYSRWIKPYLRAARKLEQNAGSNQEALVTAFNTIVLELTIMGYRDYDPKDDVTKGLLPESFAKIKDRTYHPLLIVEFKFRGIPQRVSQRGDWSFGGKTDIKFTSYALNDQELKVLNDQIEKDDLGEVMNLIEGITTESLEEIQKDIDEFLSEDKLPARSKEIKEQDTNPFSALLKGSGRKKAKEWDVKQPLEIDTEYENIIRSQAIIEARDACFNVFDIYKRAHKMAAHPNPYDPL